MGCNGRHEPQRAWLWTAHAACLIPITLIEFVTALIQSIDLHIAVRRVKTDWKMDAPVIGISPPCNCSSPSKLCHVSTTSLGVDKAKGRTLNGTRPRVTRRIMLQVLFQSLLTSVAFGLLSFVREPTIVLESSAPSASQQMNKSR